VRRKVRHALASSHDLEPTPGDPVFAIRIPIFDISTGEIPGLGHRHGYRHIRDHDSGKTPGS
jgi:hypothetical protein